MTILLIRHAESAANFDHSIYDNTPDHNIPLTEKGQQQARDAGIFLKDWYKNNPPKKEVRLWCSPYKRTLQTLMGFKETIGEWAWNKCGRGKDIHFDDRLREREWGHYSYQHYLEGTELQKQMPKIHSHYNMVRNSEMGRYYARPMGGESVADITDRLRSFFQDLYFDIQNGQKDHLIVMHGMSMLAFTYAFTKIHPRFLDDEELTGNTSIRLLDIDPETNRYMDYGIIYNPEKNIYRTEKPAKPIQRDLNKILS